MPDCRPVEKNKQRFTLSSCSFSDYHPKLFGLINDCDWKKSKLKNDYLCVRTIGFGKLPLYPLIRVTINKFFFGALLDRGAAYSLCGSEVPYIEEMECDTKVVYANGVKGHLTKARRIEILVEGKTCSWWFKVSEELPCDVIFGCDFMRRYGVQLNFREDVTMKTL